MKIKIRKLNFIILFLFPFLLNAALSGTYTIGGASPNYATFSLAVADLTANGVSGPVIFNVRAGTYNETITINNISGTSSSKYVLFQSESGLASDVVLTNTSATVILNGSKNITFKNMTINGTANPANSGSTTSATFVLQGNCNTDSLINCVLTAPLAPWTDYTYVINASSGTNDNIYMKGCQVTGGGFGYEVEGGGSNYGPYLSNNTWTNQTYMAIDLMGCNDVLIQENLITSTNSRFGIILWNATNNVNIISNKITGTIGTGMYVPTLGGGNNILIANNFIEASFGIYGIYTYNYLILNNSFLTSTYGIYMYDCSGNIVKNNIFYSTGGSYVFNLDNVSCFSASDYNDFYTTGSVATVNSTNYTTLANWQSYSGFDSHTMNIIPPYTSNTDLHLTIDNMRFGIPQPLVTYDIDNQTRNTITPDVGADEFANLITTFTVSSTTICTGITVQLTDESAGVPTTWKWTLPGGSPSSSTIQNPTVTYNTAGTYSVTLKISNAFGADSLTKSGYIHVNMTPTITVSGSITMCTGSSATLTAGGGTNYLWSTGATTNNISVSPGTTKNYLVNISNGLCVKDTSVAITINPSVTLSKAVTICVGNSTIVSAIITGGGTYLWSTTATTNIINVTPAITTTYSLEISNGVCTKDTSIRVNVNQLPSLSVSSSNLSICTGANVSVVASGALNYRWTPSTGLNTTTGGTVIMQPLTNWTYTVTGTDGHLCTSQTPVNITVFNLPTIATTPNLSICQGGTITLSATGALTYLWTYGTSTIPGQSITVNPVKATAYTVVGTDANGCVNTGNTTIGMTSPGSITVSNNVTITKGNSTNISVNKTGTIDWSPSTGLTCATCQTTAAAPQSTTTYTVIVTDTFGCSSTGEVTVMIITICDDKIYVPNAFSPNGDYINDEFHVYNTDCIDPGTYTLQIFDRWGDEIFKTTDPSAGWNGTYQGGNAENGGIYAYKLTFSVNSVASILKGNISLLR